MDDPLSPVRQERLQLLELGGLGSDQDVLGAIRGGGRGDQAPNARLGLEPRGLDRRQPRHHRPGVREMVLGPGSRRPAAFANAAHQRVELGVIASRTVSSAPPPPSIEAVSLNDPVGVLAGSGSESDRPIAARIVSVHA